MSDNPFGKSWLERHKQESVDYLILRDKAFEALAVQNEKHDSMLEDELWNEFAKEDTRLSDCLNREHKNWLIEKYKPEILSRVQMECLVGYSMRQAKTDDVKEDEVVDKIKETCQFVDLATNKPITEKESQS